MMHRTCLVAPRLAVGVLALVPFAFTLSLFAADPGGEKAKVDPALPQSWIDAFEWRSIGPANMGGRVVDIEASHQDPNIWWAATASGGLVKTENNGTTFTHQFDRENTVSIGDLAVAPSNHDILWVGTGEANPRNSVSYGDGVYKSVDGGKTWKHMGLKRIFQTGRIRIHPENPDIVYVGALGRLYGPNEERGLFKTTDGGETWKKVLYVDDKTGVIDVHLKPDDPKVILAATYERERDGFDSNDPAKKWGPGAGIWRSEDGGETFERITEGLPTCQLGRIGLDWYVKDPNRVYAVVETEKIAQEPENAPYMALRGESADAGARITDVTEDGPAAEAGLKKGDIVLSVNDETVLSYEDFTRVVRKYVAGETVKFEIARDRKREEVDITFGTRPGAKEDDEKNPEESSSRRRGSRAPFSSGLGGQRENVQDQQGKEGHEYGGIYRSDDAGRTWTRINSVNPRPMYYSQVRVDPSNNEHIYVLGTSLYRSKDGGVTFTGDGGRGVHVDHHGMWVDPRDGRHIILGCDGGIYVTYDRMEHWDHLNHVAIGQFYHVAVGPREDYRVYGGLQDNGSWGGPSRSGSGSGPLNEDWVSLGGGDGFVCRVDPEEPDLVYTESQGGSMSRYNQVTGERGYIRPRPPRGTRYRFNWKTPFILSHHNSKIFYAVGNYVFRSLNKGDKLKAISDEITRTDRGSGTAVGESHFDPDVLYAGTDDGALWRTKDGGRTWTDLFPVGKESEAEAGEAGKPAPPSRKPGAREALKGLGYVGGGEGRRGRRGESGGGRMDRARMMGRMLEGLDQMDANGDGKIQKSEASGPFGRLFDRADVNDDGVMDEKEIADLKARFSGASSEKTGAGETGTMTGEPVKTTVVVQTSAGLQEVEMTTEKTIESDPETAESEVAVVEKVEFRPEMTVKTSTGAQDVEAITKKTGPPSGDQPETPAAKAKDPLSGVWEIQPTGEMARMMPGESSSTMTLVLGEKGEVTGSLTTPFNEGEIQEGKFDAKKNRLTFVFPSEQMDAEVEATISGEVMTGSFDMGGGVFTMEFEAKRTKKGKPGESKSAGPVKAAPKGDGKPLAELIPKPLWVSSIEPSRFKAGRVYVTFDGHRSDDDAPHVLVSEDHGDTWRSLNAGLPAGAGVSRVVREDLKNQDVLYLGTEFFAFVSIDRGVTWTKLNGNLPTVAVHDFAQHPTMGDMVAGTHGRSFWILDVTPIRQFTPERVASKMYLYAPNTVRIWNRVPRRGGTNRRFEGENPPYGAQLFYSLAAKARRARISVLDAMGETIWSQDAALEPGLHRVEWNLTRATGEESSRRRRYGRGRGVEPGKYVIKLDVDNLSMTQPLEIVREK